MDAAAFYARTPDEWDEIDFPSLAGPYPHAHVASNLTPRMIAGSLLARCFAVTFHFD